MNSNLARDAALYVLARRGVPLVMPWPYGATPIELARRLALN